MAEKIDGNTLLQKRVSKQDHVLLVNPPVQDTRYAWLRWNQPVDLLRIGTFLREEVGCEVSLLDFMKPDRQGKVAQQRLPGDRQSRTVGEGEFAERYPMWRFGKDYEQLGSWVTSRRTAKENLPTQVWITSLCSYWHQGVVQVSVRARQHLPGANIVAIGNYPRLMSDHALKRSGADIVVASYPESGDSPASVSLYGNDPPPFQAISLVPDLAIQEVTAAVQKGVTSFTFFSDDVCIDNGRPLAEIIEKTHHLHRHITYHIICGLHPEKITAKVAKGLAHERVAELHFEEASVNGELNIDAYAKALKHLERARTKRRSVVVSGFVWIGRPREALDEVIQRMITVLRTVGSFILKPYTPLPGSAEHEEHRDYLATIERHEDWSPHLFPFAELNGITRADYHDLYRLAAFLNEKVRSQSFDFLEGTLGKEFLKDGIRREVWKLEPNPLRVVD